MAGGAGRGCAPEWEEVGWNPGIVGGAPGLPAGTGPVRAWDEVGGRGPETAAGFATGEAGVFDGGAVGRGAGRGGSVPVAGVFTAAVPVGCDADE